MPCLPVACAGSGDPLNKTKHSKIQFLKGSQGTRQDMNKKQRESNKKETNNKTKTTTTVVFKPKKKRQQKESKTWKARRQGRQHQGQLFCLLKKRVGLCCAFIYFLASIPHPRCGGDGGPGKVGQDRVAMIVLVAVVGACVCVCGALARTRWP